MMLMGRIAPPAVIDGAVGLGIAAMKLASFLSPISSLPYYILTRAHNHYINTSKSEPQVQA